VILKKIHPNIVGYPMPSGDIKVAAGWLIEQAGWKGHTEGSAGVHKNQALVLVNYGGADGKKILKLAKKIQESIFSKFKIKILPEVNII
jgi:UDP-N-acetylmuramate dehydrogenase